MLVELAIFSAIFSVIFAVVYRLHLKRLGLPPGIGSTVGAMVGTLLVQLISLGPTPLPLVGNTLSLASGDWPGSCFIDWRRKYGPIYTYWIGSQPSICVTGYKELIEIFEKDFDSCTERNNFAGALEILSGGNYGILYCKGDKWREQRRFTVRTLRDLGMGRNVMEQRILEEVSAFIERINRKAGEDQEFNIVPDIELSVGSIINSILFGSRFEGVSLEGYWVGLACHIPLPAKQGGANSTIGSTILRLKAAADGYMAVIGQAAGALVVAHPALFRHLPHFKSLYQRFLQCGGTLHNYFGEKIQEHINAGDRGESGREPQDYVNAYLHAMATYGADSSFCLPQLKAMCFDMWMAGQETTSGTLTWGVVYLLHYESVMRRLCDELDQVTGGNRPVVMADRASMHFMRAVISEIQRMANILPDAISRLTTKECSMNGYLIPKGTPVTAQISAVLYDDKIFKDPLTFNPDRFLDVNKRFKPFKELLPFSIGKRSCAGRPLAEMELFLFLSNVLAKFEILTATSLPPLRRILRGTVACESFKCRVKKRN